MPQPGWYDDPQDATQLRWWDGTRWSEDRRPRVGAVPPPPPVGGSYGIPLGEANPAPTPAPMPTPTPTPTPSSGPGPWGGPATAGPGVGWAPPGTPPFPGHPGMAMPGSGPAPARGFLEALTVCLKKSFDAKGRASRSEYWYFTLFSGAIFLVLLLFVFVAALYLEEQELFVDPATFNRMLVRFIGLLIVAGLVLLALVPASITVFIRRLHDAGLSGWLYLLNFVPFVGWVVFIVFGVLPPTPGPNRYG